MTEAGPAPWLRDLGLSECDAGYAYRTHLNAHDADATIIFGNADSPGCKLTRRACLRYFRPFLINPSRDRLRQHIAYYGWEVLNVAGNRESTNPGIFDRTFAFLLDTLA